MPSLFYLHIKILKALAYTKTIFQIGIFNTPQPSGGLLQPFPVSTKDNSSRKKTKGQVERPGKYQHIWHIAFISMYHTLRIMYTFCAHTPIVHILCSHTPITQSFCADTHCALAGKETQLLARSWIHWTRWWQVLLFIIMIMIMMDIEGIHHLQKLS